MPTAKSFDFGGHQVKVVIRDLPGDHGLTLDNVLGIGARLNGGRAQPGSAKASTIVAGLKRIEVDGEEIPLAGRKKPMPLILDHERQVTLFDYVLGLIVQANQHLLWKAEHADVFREHLDMVLEEEDDDEEFSLSVLETQNPT